MTPRWWCDGCQGLAVGALRYSPSLPSVIGRMLGTGYCVVETETAKALVVLHIDSSGEHEPKATSYTSG